MSLCNQLANRKLGLETLGRNLSSTAQFAASTNEKIWSKLVPVIQKYSYDFCLMVGLTCPLEDGCNQPNEFVWENGGNWDGTPSLEVIDKNSHLSLLACNVGKNCLLKKNLNLDFVFQFCTRKRRKLYFFGFYESTRIKQSHYCHISHLSQSGLAIKSFLASHPKAFVNLGYCRSS